MDLSLARVMSGWSAWVGAELQVRSSPRQHSTDVFNDRHFGERSISDCDEPFTVSLTGTKRVVLRRAPLSNKGTIFLYTFQQLIFVLIEF